MLDMESSLITVTQGLEVLFSLKLNSNTTRVKIEKISGLSLLFYQNTNKRSCTLRKELVP